MCPPSLPPPIVVADAESLQTLALALAPCPIVAVDTESNSLHAYGERVCLIQFSTADADYIVDPLELGDLNALTPLFANGDQQKVFHAAEYDLICLRRDYRFEVANIFDTMTAARTLGWSQVGLAAILDAHFGVRMMDKNYQRADWKRRPLSAEQLDYARLDTHYLVALRDRQLQALTESGRWPEAREEFERLASQRGDSDDAGPEAIAFWRVKGARDLTAPPAPLVEREPEEVRDRYDRLHTGRKETARAPGVESDVILPRTALLDLARRPPRTLAELARITDLGPWRRGMYGKPPEIDQRRAPGAPSLA